LSRTRRESGPVDLGRRIPVRKDQFRSSREHSFSAVRPNCSLPTTTYGPWPSKTFSGPNATWDT
jgi:hypothetical protein